MLNQAWRAESNIYILIPENRNHGIINDKNGIFMLMEHLKHTEKTLF